MPPTERFAGDDTGPLPPGSVPPAAATTVLTRQPPPAATSRAPVPAGRRPAGRHVAGGRHGGPRPPRRPLRRHPVVRTLGVLVLVALLLVGFSIGRVLAAPGTDSVPARLAEWARDHHLDAAVTYLEKIDYNMHKPKAGGLPEGGIPIAGGETSQAAARAARVPHTPAPPPVRVLAGGAPIPGEGQWQTVVTAKGLPAVRVAYVRPDDRHTSYLTGLMWLDPKLLASRMHPGYQDPGGQWSTPSRLTPELRRSVAAAHNGGFRLNGASRGGYWADGRMPVPLRQGAASLVLYRDGIADVGAWGREVGPSPRVASVRQNLDMLVDGGRVNPTCNDNNSPTWGYTLGNVSYVWRSGFGVTRDGGLVYAAGNALSVCTLGNILAAGGAVRGMELDINPEWTTGYYFTHPSPGGAVPHKLSPDQVKPADRYFSTQSRDFFAWYIRP